MDVLFFYCKLSNNNLSLSQVLKQTQKELTPSADNFVLNDCKYVKVLSNTVAVVYLEDYKDNQFHKIKPDDFECL